MVDDAEEGEAPERTNVKKPMSLSEAGRLGGLKRKQSLGPEGYRALGHKGGEAVADRYGPGFYEKIGQKGGEKRKASLGQEGYKELGKRGGRAVRDKYGPEFFSKIGHRGGEKVAEKYGHEFYERIGRKGGEARVEQSRRDEAKEES